MPLDILIFGFFIVGSTIGYIAPLMLTIYIRATKKYWVFFGQSDPRIHEMDSEFLIYFDAIFRKLHAISLGLIFVAYLLYFFKKT